MELPEADSPLNLDDSIFPSHSSVCSQQYSSPSSPFSSLPDLPPHWYLRDESMHDCPFHIDTCQGCDGTHTEEQFDDGVDQQSQSSGLSSVPDGLISRQRSMTPASISSVHSPEVNRMQLKEEFLKLYFPAGISDHETDFMYSKFLGRESLDGMDNSMNAAVDTLSLIQLGTSHADQRLIHEAQARYNTAVASVNAALARPDAMYNDGVLGAAYLLGFCEMYQPLGSGKPWRTHHRGLRDMLLARGPTGSYSRFAQLLVYNFRHVAAIIGCTERKKVVFSGKSWKQCSALTDGMMSALTEHIIDVPEALEAADFAMQRSTKAPSELFTVLMRLAALERDTQTWLLHWYSSFDKQPYWQQSMESFRHFRRHCANARKVFPKAIYFPSFSHASAQITYWIGLLQLKQTMIEINGMFPQGILPKSTSTLMSEANEVADKLCESVAWLTQPRYGFCGVIRAIGPLRYASKWYATQMDLAKIAWCEKVSQSIEKQSSIACVYRNQTDRSVCSTPRSYTSNDEDMNGTSDREADDVESEEVDDTISLPR